MTAVPFRAMEGAPEWWYANAGAPEGPVSFERLRELAASGRLKPTDLVWCKGMPDWVAAGTVDGLCAPVAAAADVPPLPAAAAVPPSPPSIEPPAASGTVTVRSPPAVGAVGTCPQCGIGALQASQGRRWSTPVVVIGYLILVPSVVLLLIGAVSLVAALLGISSLSNAGGGAGGDGAACAAILALAFMGALLQFAVAGGIVALVVSLIGTLIGRSLTRRIPVLRCTECGKVTKLA